MQYIYKHSLYISNPKNSLRFYIDILGMNLIKQFTINSKEFFHLRFNSDTKEAILELIFDKENKTTLFPKDKNALEGYWKMAISIKDVDIARAKLKDKGIEVSEAFQVPNVAYLCHFFDPDGYALELIQHKFQENHIKQSEDKKYALGNRAVFSLITYRVKNIKKSLDFYTKELNLKLYSKMDVSQRGFNIYFLAPDIEKMPDEGNIESIKNVQWLWQREFTFIELQHILELENNKDFKYKVGKQTGFEKVSFLSNKNENLKDPDNYNIEIIDSTL